MNHRFCPTCGDQLTTEDYQLYHCENCSQWYEATLTPIYP